MPRTDKTFILTIMLLAALIFCPGRLYFRGGAHLAATTYLGLSLIAVYILLVYDILPTGHLWERCRLILLKHEKIVLISFLAIYYVLLAFCTSHLEERYSPIERYVIKSVKVINKEGATDFLSSEYKDTLYLSRKYPPLLPLLLSVVFRVAGKSLFIARSVTNAASVLCLLWTYLLARRLYGKETAFLSAVMLGSMQLYFRCSWLIEFDILLTSLFTLAILLFIFSINRGRPIYYILTAFVILLGIMIKYSMALVVPIIILYLYQTGSLSRESGKSGFRIFCAIVAGSIASWLFFLWKNDIIIMQIKSILFHLGTTYRFICMHNLLLFIAAHIIFPLGLYNIFLIFYSIKLSAKRKTDADKLILTWAAVIFLFFALTCPDRRYFLPAYPAIAIIIVEGLRKMPKEIRLAVYSFSVISSSLLVIYYFSIGGFSQMKSVPWLALGP